MKNDFGLEDGVFYFKMKDMVYGSTIWVLISQNHSVNPCDKLINKHRPSYDYDPSHEAIAACIEHKGVFGHEVFMTFRKSASGNSKAHEAVHAKNYIFKFTGVELDIDNDEHEAYYLGFVVSVIDTAFETMIDYLKKHKKKKK